MSANPKKRSNFDVSPEQQEVLMLAKVATNSSNIKEGVLRACQVVVSLSQETSKGNLVFIGRSRETAARFIVAGLDKSNPAQEWQWLVDREHPWRTQKWVKGRKVMASTIYGAMLANGMDSDRAAKNWDLPVEAIEEIAAYCEANRPLIEAESKEEEMRLRKEGVRLEAPSR